MGYVKAQLMDMQESFDRETLNHTTGCTLLEKCINILVVNGFDADTAETTAKNSISVYGNKAISYCRELIQEG